MKLTEPYAIAAIPTLIEKKNWSQAQAEKFVKNNYFDQIESEAPIFMFMIHAAHVVGKHFGLTPEQCEKYAQELLCRTLTRPYRNKINRQAKRISTAEKQNSAKLMISMLSEAHNFWLNAKSREFFLNKMYDFEQYQYLPLVLVGWERIKFYLRFMGPIMEDIGYRINEEDLKYEYRQQVFEIANVCKRNYGTFDLKQYIINGCNGHDQWWVPEIKSAMTDVNFVQNVIVVELKENGFGKDKELMAQLAANNLMI